MVGNQVLLVDVCPTAFNEGPHQDPPRLWRGKFYRTSSRLDL